MKEYSKKIVKMTFSLSFAFLSLIIPELTLASLSAWTLQDSGTSDSLGSATFGKNIFVVGGIGGLGTILTSLDGISWTPQAPGTTTPLTGMGNDGRTFVAVGYDGTILTSPDAQTWTTHNTGTPQTLNAVTYANDMFVTVGHEGTILTSPNATNWTFQHSGTDYQLRDIAYGHNTFVAAVVADWVLTSTDGINWIKRSSVPGTLLLGLAFGDNVFVGVGSRGKIITSPDGIDWTAQDSGTNVNLARVAFGNGTFVATGDLGTILTSNDGIYWEAQESGTIKSLHNVTYGNNTFVAVGTDGTILTSILTSPNISVTPLSHDYGSVAVGDASAPFEITIFNNGNDDLVVSEISLSDETSYSLAGETTASIVPGGSHMVTVTFTPQSTGLFDAAMTITSDDPDERYVDVQLRGEGVPADGPDLTISCKAFHCTDFGKSIGVKLMIENLGNENAAAFKAALCLSPDGIDLGEPLAERPVGEGLKAGRSIDRVLKYSSINSLSGYYIVAVVDSDDEVLETNETNNAKAILKLLIP